MAFDELLNTLIHEALHDTTRVDGEFLTCNEEHEVDVPARRPHLLVKPNEARASKLSHLDGRRTAVECADDGESVECVLVA